eukprot:8392634-Alexandrium_andersonii.AAC.1
MLKWLPADFALPSALQVARAHRRLCSASQRDTAQRALGLLSLPGHVPHDARRATQVSTLAWPLGGA